MSINVTESIANLCGVIDGRPAGRARRAQRISAVAAAAAPRCRTRQNIVATGKLGGDQNAELLGENIGEVIWQVAGIASGVGGATKATAALAKVGVQLSETAVAGLKHRVGFGDGVDASNVGKLNDVWSLKPIERGNFESNLSKTEYKDWFNVGQLDQGKFPLVDFQKGNVLVSLKSVDTTGKSWLGRIEDHIEDLGSNAATVDGQPARMVLDIRVQRGGAIAAQPLIEFGKKNNVTVLIKEFE